MMAMWASGSLSFLTVPMATRVFNLAIAAFPPIAARCLLMISAAVSCGGSSKRLAATGDASSTSATHSARRCFITPPYNEWAKLNGRRMISLSCLPAFKPLYVKRGALTAPLRELSSQRKLENDLAGNLHVAAILGISGAAEASRNITGVDFRLDADDIQIGVIEDIVGFKTQV